MESTILERVARALKSGKCFSVEYMTDVQTSASAKHAGVIIAHYAKEQARTGIDYEKAAFVKAMRAQGIEYTPQEYESVVARKMQHNEKNGNDYLLCYFFNSSKDVYIVKDENGKTFTTDLDGIEKWLTPSAFRERKNGKNYFILKAQNILRIKQGDICEIA